MNLNVIASGLILLCCFGGDLIDAKKPEEAPKELWKEVKLGSSLEGLYACKGNDGENDYFYTVKLKKVGDGYLVYWLGNTGQVTLGIGARDGDKLNIGWKNGAQIGIHSMEVKGKDLEGKYLSFVTDEIVIKGVQREFREEVWKFLVKE